MFTDTTSSRESWGSCGVTLVLNLGNCTKLFKETTSMKFFDFWTQEYPYVCLNYKEYKFNEQEKIVCF